jgi:hypothetical protein
MIQMDPGTAAAVVTGLATLGVPAAGTIKELVVRLLGPATDVKAQQIKEWVEERHRRGEQVIDTSVKILISEGVRPHEVPPRILVPLLKRASLEDEEQLRIRWATMLANFADGARSPDMLPGFIDVLHSLSSLEVQFLTYAYEDCYWSADGGRGEYRVYRVDHTKVRDRFGLSRDQYLVMAGNLLRLNLVTTGGGGGSAMLGDEQVEDALYGQLALTVFGEAFVKSCRRDTRHESVGHMIHR